MKTIFEIYEEICEEKDISFLKIRQLKKEEVKNLLDEIDDYNENPHYFRKKFERSFSSDCKYFGLFDEEKCLALLSVEENVPEKGFTYFHELVSFFPGKGFGVSLLKQILKKFKDVWWMASPDGGEKLANNYRKISGAKEYTVKNSSYKKLDIHFFHTIKDKTKISELISFLEKTWKKH